MIIIAAAVITLGMTVNPLFITACIAFIAAVGIYELLHNAAKIESKAAIIGASACTISGVMVIPTRVAPIKPSVCRYLRIDA